MLTGHASAAEAAANNARPAAGRAGPEVEEIVVTARKEAETILTVPEAITAFTSKNLEQRQVRSLADIAMLTPGLSFSNFSGGGTATPVIRGATQQTSTVLEQNVSTFLDGVYIPRQYVIDLGTDFLERVEVVKGPQGALYGQNSFMGAINYVTKAPSDGFSGSARATIGNDDLYETSGTVSVPIVPGKVRVRLNGAYSTFDGTWVNHHPLAGADIAGPHTHNNFDGWKKWNVGARVLITPTDNLRIDASYRHFDTKNDASARINFTGNTFLSSPLSVTTARNNCGVVGALGAGLYCGELPNVNPDTFVMDPRQFGAQSKTDFAAVNLDYNPIDRLDVKYGFGYIKSSVLQISSQSDWNMLIPNQTMSFAGIPIGGLKYYQHEIRVKYNATDNLEISLGGFYSKNRDSYTFLLGSGIPTLSTTPVTVANLKIVASDTRTTSISKAIFGAARLKMLGGRARLSFEGRYSWESKTVFSVGPNVSRGLDSSFFNPRVTFDFDVAPETMVYASAANGTKAGGVNADPAIYAPYGGLLASERTFGPDKNWTYEAGVKSRQFDKRLQIEADIFYVDLSSLQVNTLSTTPPGFVLPPGIQRAPTILMNLGGATVKGVEFQGQFRATDELTLLFGGSYQRARYKAGVPGTRTLDICDGKVCGPSIGGHTMQGSPSTHLFAGFLYEQPIDLFGRDATLNLQGDLAYQNKEFTDETNTAWIAPHTLVNMSAGVTRGPLSLKVWAKNLTNENYIESATFGPFTTSFYTPIPGQLRTFGATLGVDF